MYCNLGVGSVVNLCFLMLFAWLEALAQDPREAEFLRQYREAVAQVGLPLALEDHGGWGNGRDNISYPIISKGVTLKGTVSHPAPRIQKLEIIVLILPSRLTGDCR